MSDSEIRDAERVAMFLADAAVSEALVRLDQRYYAEFKVAESPELRAGAWAKARVLTDFRQALQAIVDSGFVKKAHRDRSERR